MPAIDIVLNKGKELLGERVQARFGNEFPIRFDFFDTTDGVTLHCSGRNTMVLEISSAPYIFTFKLQDWGRLGLDGKPRPINIKHGSKVINYSRDTKWVKENLINKFEVLEKTDTHKTEKTRVIAFLEQKFL